MSPGWLADAVVYEIYPQSFSDSDGDGIGDLRGVIRHLDHLQWLGVNTIWFNPCFDSPFVDAGYDVRDFYRVADRYGTNDDLAELVVEADRRDIRVLLDLVAGHTSIEHQWFQDELHADGPSPEGDRYVWCEDPTLRDTSGDLAGMPSWVPSPGPRPGHYLKNFYDAQPALNYGWANGADGDACRDAIDDPGPARNRQMLRDVMAYWFDRGVAGFRVDMAWSLVKDDPDLSATVELWRDLRAWLDAEYPDRVIIPEGPEPRTGGPLGFHADFFLVIFDPHASLFDNRGAGRLPFTAGDPPYFDAAGEGSPRRFISQYEQAREADPDRLVLLATADHDFSRLATGERTPEQLRAAYTFLMTWGTVPSIYYGDEIGMRYLPGLPEVEGSICNPTYNRAGCRTPMQWDDSPNAGFSTAAAEDLYLPIDPDPDRPTVAAQLDDESSVMHLVRRLVHLRRSTPELGPHASTEVLHDGYPLVYVRGGTHLVAVNPSGAEVVFDAGARVLGAEPVVAEGVTLTGSTLTLDPFAHGILRLT